MNGRSYECGSPMTWIRNWIELEIPSGINVGTLWLALDLDYSSDRFSDRPWIISDTTSISWSFGFLEIFDKFRFLDHFGSL